MLTMLNIYASQYSLSLAPSLNVSEVCSRSVRGLLYTLDVSIS